MDTESFIIHIKTKYLYKGTANDAEKCFDTSNYDDDVDRPPPKGMNKRIKVFLMINQEAKI